MDQNQGIFFYSPYLGFFEIFVPIFGAWKVKAFLFDFFFQFSHISAPQNGQKSKNHENSQVTFVKPINGTTMPKKGIGGKKGPLP